MGSKQTWGGNLAPRDGGGPKPGRKELRDPEGWVQG